MSERRLNFGFGRNHEVEVGILATRAGIAVEVSSDDMTTWDATWDELVPDSMKVVPADAIVIEPLDFGDEQALSIAANALGYAPRTAAEVARLHEHVTYLASALARLQKHPPIDEALIDPLAEAISDAYGFGDDHAAPYHVARHLLEQGWTKPEQTP